MGRYLELAKTAVSRQEAMEPTSVSNVGKRGD